MYVDGRGVFTRFEKAAVDGQLVALQRDDGTLEVIPVGECEEFGVSLDGLWADFEGAWIDFTVVGGR